MIIGIISNSPLHQPLLAFLQSNGVRTEVYSGDDPYEWHRKLAPTHTFVYGYKNFIDPKKMYNDALYNIHHGALPKYRGPSPLFWQIKNGEPELTVAIHEINERLDAGDVVWQRSIPNDPHVSFGMADFLFSNFIIEGVNQILSGNFQRNKQEENLAVYYKRPALNDVWINWNKMTSGEIQDLVKACNPWNNGAIAQYQNMEVKILDAEPGADCTGIPGIINATGEKIEVCCMDKKSVLINMFSINGIFVPSRFSDKYGILKGQGFISPDS